MSAPALPVSLDEALREHDRVGNVPGVLPVTLFLESLLGLILPSLATLSAAQSERLEAAYLAGAKCIDDAGLLLAVPRDSLLILTAPDQSAPSPTKDTFDAVARAMGGIVRAYPSSPRPDYINAFILAVGGPVQLAKMGHQAVKDAADAELWRFMLASISDSSDEYRIMESLADSFELNTEDAEQARLSFEAHVRAGVAQLQDEQAALELEHERAGQ